MIVGVGIDIVAISRLEAALARTPSLRERLFTPAEASLPPESLAGRFAAKEAVAKALFRPKGMACDRPRCRAAPTAGPFSPCWDTNTSPGMYRWRTTGTSRPRW